MWNGMNIYTGLPLLNTDKVRIHTGSQQSLMQTSCRHRSATRIVSVIISKVNSSHDALRLLLSSTSPKNLSNCSAISRQLNTGISRVAFSAMRLHNSGSAASFLISGA